MSQKLKVVTIGDGSSYTPELLEGSLRRHCELSVIELWLVDVEEGQEKPNIIHALCERTVEKAGVPMKIYKTLDRRAVLQGADLVTTQLRVGQLKACEKDEHILLSHGHPGQEANGAGGLFRGLRITPVIFDIVKDVQEICPDAWIIDFINPAGMVTGAAYHRASFKHFIGVCSIPIGMKMFIIDVLQLSPSDELNINLFGPNHLVFVRDVLVNGVSRFDELLDGVAFDRLTANLVKNIFGLPFSEGLIRSLRLIPCFYLLYYFKPREMLAIEMSEYYKDGMRAQVVQKVEKQLFELYKNPDLKVKPKELKQHGDACYSDTAHEVTNTAYNDKQTEHYVNISHHGHVDNIPADWAAEMSCTLGRDGAKPTPRVTHFDEKVLGFIYTVKGFEVAASQAAISGELNDVLLVLNLSSLICFDRDAEQLAREMTLAYEKWLPNLAATIEKLESQQEWPMERVLTVSVDDFGLNKGQNHGIIEAYRNGVVISTTVLVNGAAIGHAAQLSRSTPELVIGMHFVLTLDEPPSATSGLTREGWLGKWTWQQTEEGRLPLEEIAYELACQYRRLVDLFGHKPTHFDNYHHVHMISPIHPIVVAFARKKDIALCIDRQVAAQSGLNQQAARSSAGLSSEFYGEAVSEKLFLQTLDALIARGERSLEVMCHPAFVDQAIMGSAYCYPRLGELNALASAALKAVVADWGYRLGIYRDV